MRFAGDDLTKALQVKGTTDGSLIAGRPANMPSYIYESMQRQIGPHKGYGKFMPEDAKNVQGWGQGLYRI